MSAFLNEVAVIEIDYEKIHTTHIQNGDRWGALKTIYITSVKCVNIKAKNTMEQVHYIPNYPQLKWEIKAHNQ